MCDSELKVKVKSHSGGRVRDVENTLIKRSETDQDYMKQLDTIVLHVGTNNISDAKCSEQVVDEFKDTISTIRSLNPRTKIIVSSIIPRRNDRHMNTKIQQTNSDLQMMCDAQGLYYLNNNSHFVSHGRPVQELYRDHIHLNARGGKVLGTNITSSLKTVLGISSHGLNSSIDNSNFHYGKHQGRTGQHQNKGQMYVMPM